MVEAGSSHMMSVSLDSGGGGDRFPQWSVQETRDFLMIRAELDQTFMETKRNKVLWELISTKMKEIRGYNRSAEQCKCKWKNLVTRYKGYETMEEEGMRQQFPYYNELQRIFTDRMQRMLWTAGSSSNLKKRSLVLMHSSSDEESTDHHHHHQVETISTAPSTGHDYKKRKTVAANADNSSNYRMVKEILEEIMKQQMQREMEWMKIYESKEEERRMREMEWRRKMEALENERTMLDRSWREKEEERRIKEEMRSEKRDALITLILNKLTSQQQ